MNSPTSSTDPVLEQAKLQASQAIDLLLAHGVPPSPVNYAVAYEYGAGRIPALNGVIDAHLAKNHSLDEFILRELYEQHVASEHFRQFGGMRNDLHNILHTLLENIEKASTHADAYQEALEQSISELGEDQGEASLRRIASNLIASTIEADTQNQTLQVQLDTARRESEELRNTLEQHRREALIDPLTGLYNRRGMEYQMEEIMGMPDYEPLAMLVIDIDHFKQVNDTYGHAIGDIVIRNVADVMRKSIRGEDIAVRYGGEEFVVVLPNTPLEGAVKVAETIRSRIESLRLYRRHDNFKLTPFTISLGVAVQRADDNHDSLFQRADEALYLSKHNGRNRVSHEGALTQH